MSVPSEIKPVFIEYILEIIELFKNDYKEVFLLRDLIENDYKSDLNNIINQYKKIHGNIPYELLNQDKTLSVLSKKVNDKKKFLSLIRSFGRKFPLYDYYQLIRWLKISLNILDFVFGETLENISKSYGAGFRTVQAFAQLLFSEDNEMYKRRFYKNQYYLEDVFSIADEVNRGEITERSFKNLIHPQMQDLIAHYRKEKKKKVGLSIFQRVSVDTDFTRWVDQLPKEKLEQMLEQHVERLSVNSLLMLCSEINKNLEILKFIIYSLINTSKNAYKISKISGKNMNFIEKYESLLYERKVI
ncbi:MAG: hypothetical protein ACFFBC_00530 [Promethearchaeota archaeon]